MFSLPHSGQGKPPMYGDFEAQRHWMEITVGLPVGEWYRHTNNNDLMYWGLDYPPLTAFTSWLFGKLAQASVPELVALRRSRGHESDAGKLFMRLSVLACDVAILIPACLLWVALLRAASQRRSGSSKTDSVARGGGLLLLMLLNPALLLIDHAHFQYNNASLGLTLLAIACAAAAPLTGWMAGHLACAFFFSLALNFKQMCLYYAPAFFVYLLVLCLRRGLPAVGLPSFGARAATSSSSNASGVSTAEGVVAVAVVGAVVIATFALMWAPFCILAPPELGCISSLAEVVDRLFPFDRGLFEDKVANIWCALEPVLKLRSQLFGRAPGAAHRLVLTMCTAVTIALMAPSLSLLARHLWRSLGVQQLQQGQQAAPPAVAAAGVTATPVRAAAPKQQRGRSASKGRKTAAAAAAAGAPPAVAVAAVPAPSASANSTAQSPQQLYLFEHLVLTMFNVSLSFFLASYQVHEKSILLPLLPLLCLAHRLPALSCAFSVLATYSMGPLLVKDGVALQAVALCVAYVYLAWPTEDTWSVEAGAVSQVLLRMRMATSPAAATSAAQQVLRVALFAAAAGMIGLSAVAAVVPPPASLPDVHAYLNACLSAALLLVCLLLTTVVQWNATTSVPAPAGRGRSNSQVKSKTQ